ncbi:MAG: hypothetical protein K9K36_02300 [Desulfarculaceae bacterium]|nr:hypothetical protein [Desulfarculaceae bacterium]
MARALSITLSLLIGLALLMPLSARAGRIGFKNNHPLKCYAFMFQTMKWNSDQHKWEPLSDRKFQFVKPGETHIYDGITDAIQWISAAQAGDARCYDPSTTGYVRIWWTATPTEWGTLNAIVDERGNVDVKQVR